MTFAKGDRVRCVDSGLCTSIQEDAEYTVVHGDGRFVELDINAVCRHFYYRRFVLANPPIGYGPGTTRYGFMQGDRVQWRSRAGGELRTGRVMCEQAYVPEVYVDSCGGWSVPARDLTLLSHDTGDPGGEIAGHSPGPLAAIGATSHANAKAKGFYAELEFARHALDCNRADEGRVLRFVENLWLLARCALVHSEVSEMVEAIRDGAIGGSTGGGKPEGLPSEMADTIIRLADLAHSLGIDIDSAVAEKAAYNATRPAKHGRSSGL